MLRALVVGFVFSTSTAAFDCDSLLENLRSQFREKNPNLSYVQVIDTKPRHSEYWVLARGIREDRTFQGSFDDEMFGLFVVDSGLVSIKEVVGFFPTKRWNDYEAWIESYSMDKVTVRAHGSYGDQAWEKTYSVPWE